MFYVYLDWTLGESPYVFYVGKGSDERVKFLVRNELHQNISAKHGMRREVLLSTRDESFAFEEEVRLIKEHDTYHFDNSKGANFTRGGEGSSGYVMTEEVKARISQTHRGKVLTDEHRVNIGKAKAGVRRDPFSPEHRARMSAAQTGYKQSESHKQKTREGRLKRSANRE